LGLDTLLVFACLYNVSFLAAPSLTTGRLALGLLLAAYGVRLLRLAADLGRQAGAMVLVFALVLTHALLLYVTGDGTDTVQVSRLLNFAAFVVVTGLALALHVGGDAVRFAHAVALATLVQSVFIVVSYQSAEYRNWLAGLVVQGGHIPLTMARQAPGFSNSSGAALSLTQALGVFAALYSMQGARGGRAVGWALVAAATLLSTLLVGRTGLLLGLGFLAAYAVLAATPRMRVALAGLSVALVLAVVNSADAVVDLLGTRNPLAAETIERAVDALRSGWNDPSIVDVRSQPVPPVDLQTVVGTGRVVDEFGLNASGHDSGYVQTYFALGLPATVFFYGSWLMLVAVHLVRARHRAALGILTAAMLVAEAKEPFIFKYAMPLVLWTLVYLEAAARDRGQAA
jgi:hypothetical protein